MKKSARTRTIKTSCELPAGAGKFPPVTRRNRRQSEPAEIFACIRRYFYLRISLPAAFAGNFARASFTVLLLTNYISALLQRPSRFENHGKKIARIVSNISQFWYLSAKKPQQTAWIRLFFKNFQDYSKLQIFQTYSPFSHRFLNGNKKSTFHISFKVEQKGPSLEITCDICAKNSPILAIRLLSSHLFRRLWYC